MAFVQLFPLVGQLLFLAGPVRLAPAPPTCMACPSVGRRDLVGRPLRPFRPAQQRGLLNDRGVSSSAFLQAARLWPYLEPEELLSQDYPGGRFFCRKMWVAAPSWTAPTLTAKKAKNPIGELRQMPKKENGDGPSGDHHAD